MSQRVNATWNVVNQCLRIRASLALLLLGVAFVGQIDIAAAGIRLQISQTTASDGWKRLYSEGAIDQVHLLERSLDLKQWSEIATLHDGPFQFADPASPQRPSAFYRVRSRAKTTLDDGKNLISFPVDAFESPLVGSALPRWIKFAILLNDTNRVWFQDSAKYAFHYDYAVKRLTPFNGLTSQQFDAVTLYRTNQQAVLGAVLYAPADAGAEYGIQFVGLEAYSPEQVAAWFRLVQSAIYSDAPAQAFYLPTVEQWATAENNRAYLQSRGVTVSRVDRWFRTDACYSPGWAVGRLVFLHANEIDAAYADGRLLPADILLTDGIPTRVPYMAGIISLVPATPNSHVAILARSYSVPFVYLADTAKRELVQRLIGQDVVFRLNVGYGYCDASILPMPASLDASLRKAILELKAPVGIQITSKAHYGAISADTAALTPGDLRYFGGKASHYGILRRALPDHSLPAIAFSFDLWDEFMAQTLPNSTNSLRAEIRNRLANFHYPPDMTAARAALAGIRDLIEDVAQFSWSQKTNIITALQVFDPARKIRFRSSTNVEDSDDFTGAGLYSSYSGCLADDLAGDAAGPSECDPTEPKRRGVFRAMQRVYASFYNENAWLERLRLGINEEEVGMALLVHHSFPDETEMANGVATVQFQRFGEFSSYTGDLATQAGAVSVANPTGGALPELVYFSSTGTDIYLETRERSNLVPLGANVLTWQSDYLQLARLLMTSVDGYTRLFPSQDSLVLDLEYKKVEPGKFDIKQIRAIPQPRADETLVPFLLSQPMDFCVQQGDGGDAFAIHRLKCRLHANTRNLRMDATNSTAPLYLDTAIEMLSGAKVIQLTNGSAGWPQASYSQAGDVVKDSWILGSDTNRADYTLETTLVRSVAASTIPIFTPADLAKTLRVSYATPMTSLDFAGNLTQVAKESVRLVPVESVTSKSRLQNRQFSTSSGVTIEASFYWPEPPQGPTAGYTAPAIQWVQTRITGLTTAPLVLRGYYSQTYHPFHHNFVEEFIFEPQLDPDTTTEQLSELQAANVQLLYAKSGDGSGAVWVMGYDGKFTQLGGKGKP